jgi:MPBQ/MSBQ methyltransferase
MLTDAGLSLTRDELSIIETHLREQYRGVFDDKMIEAHLHEFVESRLADSLAAVVAGSRRSGETLLDIGAGYGAFVLSCRRNGIDAIGFELAPFEVDISRRRLARAEPGIDASAVFQKGDAGRLTFPDSTFHIVSLLNVLEHVPDYRRVLAEATRVLRPGGRLFVVCPNYAALRKEAHYHVPWLPYFPRRIATAYLRLLGRNPGFFQQHVYYCTNQGNLNALNKLGMRSTSLDILRLEYPELINSARARRILSFLRDAHMLPVVKLAFAINFLNPFKSAVTVVAEKKPSQ